LISEDAQVVFYELAPIRKRIYQRQQRSENHS